MKKETGTITVGDKTFEATMVTLEPDLQKKDVIITENKTTKIEADSEYDGLEEVNVTTDVQGGIDPSGANAQPSDVAYGRTFYAGNEVEKTGTLEEYQGATNITTNGMLATKDKIMRDNININIQSTANYRYYYVVSLPQPNHNDGAYISTMTAFSSSSAIQMNYIRHYTIKSPTITNPRVYLSDGTIINTGRQYLYSSVINSAVDRVSIFIDNNIQYRVTCGAVYYNFTTQKFEFDITGFDMSTGTLLTKTYTENDTFDLYVMSNIDPFTGWSINASMGIPLICDTSDLAQLIYTTSSEVDTSQIVQPYSITINNFAKSWYYLSNSDKLLPNIMLLSENIFQGILFNQTGRGPTPSSTNNTIIF